MIYQTDIKKIKYCYIQQLEYIVLVGEKSLVTEAYLNSNDDRQHFCDSSTRDPRQKRKRDFWPLCMRQITTRIAMFLKTF